MFMAIVETQRSLFDYGVSQFVVSVTTLGDNLNYHELSLYYIESRNCVHVMMIKMQEKLRFKIVFYVYDEYAS